MKRLLLLGGGHSHVFVLRAIRGAPLPDTRVTLISRTRFTPYSGMLPGLMAGLHSFEESHIDLEWLSHSAGCEFVEAEADRIDPDQREVTCRGGERFGYDLISFDIGSLPGMAAAPGASAHALPVKPVDRFLDGWKPIEARIAAGDAPRVAVVGGGAGGVELLLSLQYRLTREIAAPARFTLVTDQADILLSHNGHVRRMLRAVLSARQVDIRVNHPVVRVDAAGLDCANGARIEAAATIWVTTASAPPWIAASGLEVDSRGFVAVNDCLQSVSHEDVFAAGDIATMVHHVRPKSGVYAVRQGPPLARNLRRALAGERLIEYTPQRTALALIGTGDRNAVAAYGPLAAQGEWVWRWKTWIDRRWMRAYRPTGTGT
jgi:selenide,water dikinase